jgi:hypothetical protein
MSTTTHTPATDREILNWLQEQVVDVIYLDDGRIIEVRGGSIRKALYAAILRAREGK